MVKVAVVYLQEQVYQALDEAAHENDRRIKQTKRFVR
jgi:hypothetical protein